jgi:ribosomal protein L37E
MAQVRPIKLSGNNRSETDPAADEITFLSVTSPNFIAGDVVLCSADGTKHWRLVEGKRCLRAVNENTGETFKLGMRTTKHKYAKCRRCGVRAKREKTRCTSCGKKNKKVVKP